MQYLDLSYREDFIVLCGDIEGKFKTLAFNVVQKRIENAIVIVAGNCEFGFNRHCPKFCVNENRIQL